MNDFLVRSHLSGMTSMCNMICYMEQNVFVETFALFEPRDGLMSDFEAARAAKKIEKRRGKQIQVILESLYLPVSQND